MAECPRCGAQSAPEANFCHVCGTSLETSDARVVHSGDPLAGRVIADRYRILSLVGRGGMGVVYRGEHVHMGKSVAIKLLHGELASRKDQVKRFKREAQAISQLSNIHTVTIFDYGRSQGLIYLVMEYLEGRDVGWVLRSEGKLGFLRTVMIAVQLCDSLAEAHDSGIVHRDLKPENVFLIEKRDMKDFVKVLDFGLAKVRVGIERPDETAHGAILGTPYYMPPEQIRGEQIDHRADIYALGGLTYCMLTGHPPYRAPTPLAVMAKHLTDPVPDLSDSGLSAESLASITPVVQRCLAKEPADRYDSAEELKAELLGILEIQLALEQGTSSPRLPPVTGEYTLEKSKDSADSDSPAQIKEEFERYARRLRMRRMAAGLGAVLFVTALAAAAAALVLHGKRAPVHCRDAEPNDSPATAVPIAPGDRVAGTLGKRLSATESDHDWFVLQIPPGEPALARIHLRRVPGVDTMLELFRSGDKEAVASARAGGAGKDEAISGVMLDPGLYYVLVRQDLARGGRPVESISDGYELTVTLQDPAGFETEPNDTFQTACNISVPAVIEGFVQSPSDRDVYCVRPSGAAALTARLGGPHDLLLSLSAVDVATGKWTTVAASAGTSEILMTDLACDGTEGLCLQVAPADGGYDVSTSYTLSLE